MDINLNINLNVDNRIIKISKKLFSKRGAFAFMTFLLIISTIMLQGSQIAKPYDFIEDTVINPDEVNANFDALYAESNAQDSRIFNLENRPTSLGLLTVRVYDGGTGDQNPDYAEIVASCPSGTVMISASCVNASGYADTYEYPAGSNAWGCHLYKNGALITDNRDSIVLKCINAGWN